MAGTSGSFLSDREKAALLYFAAGFVSDWTETYIIAEDKSTKDAESIKYLPSMVSRWRNSEKVRNYLKKAQKFFADIEANGRQEGRQEERKEQEERTAAERATGESVRTNDAGTPRENREIDYSNPEERKRLYNRIIATTDDPKTKLDAAKLIETTQKDTQAARDNQIQRVYTPLNCKSCPLYLSKAGKKE